MNYETYTVTVDLSCKTVVSSFETIVKGPPVTRNMMLLLGSGVLMIISGV